MTRAWLKVTRTKTMRFFQGSTVTWPRIVPSCGGQTYLYRPGTLNMYVKDLPGRILPESNTLAPAGLDTWFGSIAFSGSVATTWETPPSSASLTHSTACPTLTVSRSGTNFISSVIWMITGGPLSCSCDRPVGEISCNRVRMIASDQAALSPNPAVKSCPLSRLFGHQPFVSPTSAVGRSAAQHSPYLLVGQPVVRALSKERVRFFTTV